MLWFYRLANRLFRLLFLVLFDYRVEGLEKVPPSGPLLVAINHFSWTDPFMAAVFICRPITMMGKAELLEIPVFRWLVQLYGTVPVRRGQADHIALRKGLEVLERGGALLIAPEGTRGKEGTLKPGREGTALVAYRSGATILPVAIWGAKVMWHNMARLRRTEVCMVIGDPFAPPPPAARRANRQELEALTEDIMLRLARLLPAEYRGVYAEAVEAQRLQVGP